MMHKKKSKRRFNKVDFRTGDLIGEANMVFDKGNKALVRRARSRGIERFMDLEPIKRN